MDDPTREEQPPSQAQPTQGPLTQAPAAFATVGQQGNGLAVAGFVLGITSVIFCWWGIFALVQVILAITFSAIGRGHAKQGAPHRGLATAGLVLGIIGAVLYLMIGLLSFGAGFFI
ncbi:MAG TPA: DUF4190 domain-containing protein [Candidatus Dormibacteraeota bacterium]|nr:DUF4190 domain-containing protein [Candidatus Dormibacteraeota bacterium]